MDTKYKLSKGVMAAIIITPILIVGALFLLPNQASQPSVQVDQSTESLLTVEVFFSDRTISESVSINPSSTVYSALESLTQKESLALMFDQYSGLGILVTQIGDDKNGEGGKYWMYKVNGKYAQVAADSYQLMAGDRVEWLYQMPPN